MIHQEYLKLTLLLSLTGIVSAQNLYSIGDMASANFNWATGVPVLTFKFDFLCPSICRYNWFFGGVNVGRVDETLCDKFGTYAAIQCEVGDGYVNSTLTLEQQFNVVGDTELRVLPTGGATVVKQVIVKNCTNSSGNIDNVTSSISPEATCGYNCSTKISCKDPYVSEVENPIAVCQFNATWLQKNSCIENTSIDPDPLPGWAIFLIVLAALVVVFAVLFIVWWLDEAFRECLHGVSECFPEDHCCGKGSC